MNARNLPLPLMLFFVFSVCAIGTQQINKQFVLALPDTADDHTSFSIDINDNYCYFHTYDNGPVYTNKGTYGPFKVKDEWKHLFYTIKGRDQYIKTRKNPVLYGPVNGAIDFVYTRSKDDNLAYTISTGDSVGYIVDGNLVGTTGDTVIDEWCSFSENGNVIYTVRKGNRNYLFLNYKLIDSSIYRYGMLAIDDENNFRYSLGYLTPAKRGSYNIL